MLSWFSGGLLESSSGFDSSQSADTSVRECTPRPTVSVVGREEDVIGAEVNLKAFGKPWNEGGVYAWSVDSGTCTMSSKQGSRIDVTRDTPGTVRLKVTYAIDSNHSEPAYHTIKFVAHPVYVVGAGAAGLKAAEHLLRNGFKVVLCEATNRIGGRARTENALDGAFKVDLGCQWFHGDHWAWELTRTDIDSAGFRRDDQRSVYPQLTALWPWPEDVETILGEAWEAVEAVYGDNDQQAASTHVPAYAVDGDFRTSDAVGDVYTERRSAWVQAQAGRDNDQFNLARQANFESLCRTAYTIQREKLGPLEEAAEWTDFCNIDLDGHDELGDEAEEGVDLDDLNDQPWHNQNAWYLGGYGGLLEAYGDYLKRTYGSRLWIRKETSVTRVACGVTEPELTIGGFREKASAVIVTVSTGVVNAGGLVFAGGNSAAVTTAYGRLPMGNYKKVVFVFDRDVALAAAGGAAGGADTHRGTSVYWYLDGNNRLWKFLVPDVNRRIVITIVGGALADALDASPQTARNDTLAALQAAGVVANQAVVQSHFVSTWGTEPSFRGAYSYTAVNGGGARETLIGQPLMANGVALAGEALYVSYGTAHGAYVTGLRAAKAVVAALPMRVYDTAENMV